MSQIKAENIPLVTFGLPAYKGKHFREALESLKCQAFKNFEVIVQDDASPDNLNEIFSDVVGGDCRFFYERSEVNSSPNFVKNWDLVLQKARGDYFVLASDDDIYTPDFLSKLLELTEKYPKVDIFNSRYVRFNDDGMFGLVTKPAEYESQVECMYAMICENRYPIAPNVLVRTEALRRIGGFVNLPAASFSDYLTWIKLARNGYVTSPEVLLYWRYDGTNITSCRSSFWDRQKFKAVISAQPMFVKVCDSLISKNEIDEFQINSIRYKVTDGYYEWMVFRYINGASIGEYVRYYWERVKAGKLSRRGFFRICLCRLLRL